MPRMSVYQDTDIHPSFRVFKEFMKHMGPMPDAKYVYIARKHYDKPYGPGNAYWTTSRHGIPRTIEGAERTVIFRGKKWVLQDLVLKYREVNGGLSRGDIDQRLTNNWSVEDAVLTPRKTRVPKRVTFNGVSMTLKEASQFGAKRHQTSLNERIFKLGWPVEKAVETPSLRGKG